MKLTKHMKLELTVYLTHKKLLDKYKELNEQGIVSMKTGSAITAAIYGMKSNAIVKALISDQSDEDVLRYKSDSFIKSAVPTSPFPYATYESYAFRYAVPVNAVNEPINQSQAEFNAIVKLSGLALATALSDNGLRNIRCLVSDKSPKSAATSQGITTISAVSHNREYPYGIWKYAIPVGKNDEPFIGTVNEYLKEIHVKN